MFFRKPLFNLIGMAEIDAMPGTDIVRAGRERERGAEVVIHRHVDVLIVAPVTIDFARGTLPGRHRYEACISNTRDRKRIHGHKFR